MILGFHQGSTTKWHNFTFYDFNEQQQVTVRIMDPIKVHFFSNPDCKCIQTKIEEDKNKEEDMDLDSPV